MGSTANSPCIRVLYTIDRQTNQNLMHNGYPSVCQNVEGKKKRWLDEKQLEAAAAAAALFVTCFLVDNKMYHFSSGDAMSRLTSLQMNMFITNLVEMFVVVFCYFPMIYIYSKTSVHTGLISIDTHINIRINRSIETLCINMTTNEHIVCHKQPCN